MKAISINIDSLKWFKPLEEILMISDQNENLES